MFTMSKRSVALIYLLALTALLLTACSSPVETGTASAQEPARSNAGITVVGQGRAFGEPDEAQLVLGFEILAGSVAEATQANDAAIQEIMDALVDLGIERKDIQTMNYSLWSEQRPSDEGATEIQRYRLHNQIRIVVRDIDEVSNVLTTAIEAGANNIQGISFNVADPSALEAEAREAAMVDARSRAEALAELAGVEVGEVQFISEVIGQMPPGPLGGGGRAVQVSDEASIAPGQLTFIVQVQVTYTLK